MTHGPRFPRALSLLLAFGGALLGAGCEEPADEPAVAVEAPQITVAPQSQEVTEGEDAIFTVAARGGAPLHYVWRRNGEPLDGIDGNTLTLRQVRPADDGALVSVSVGNAAGTADSAAVSLRVVERPVAPSIEQGPLAVAVVDGAVVAFEVRARGTAPLRYRWRRNGAEIAGVDGPQWIFTASRADDGALYAVVVGNAAGSVTSEAARLTVQPAPVAARIVVRPQPRRVTEGQTARFEVVADGTAPITYQWRRNGVAIAGATGASFDLTHAARADDGALFDVDVENGAGHERSEPVALNVVRPLPLALLAGSAGGWGNLDGTATQARLGGSARLAIDAQGRTWYADTYSHVIRRITPDGTVTTVAGQAGRPGRDDGPAALARFNQPTGLALAPNGELLIADSGNRTVRRLDTEGRVSTIAGRAGVSGNDDGPASNATFGEPSALAIASDGRLVIADASNATIRELRPDGTVTTLAGLPLARGVDDGVGPLARFGRPVALACGVDNGSGCRDTVIVVDQSAQTLRQVRLDIGAAGQPKGEVVTVAGGPGQAGLVDGDAKQARFAGPVGIAMLGPQRYVVADGRNQVLRQVDLGTPAGLVSTWAGTAGTSGWADGLPGTGRFYGPADVAARPELGLVVVADAYNDLLRRVAADGRVTTVAGMSPMYGTADGRGAAARFYAPRAVTTDRQGTSFVADGCAVRRVRPDGQTDTLAGDAMACGQLDGTGRAARFGSLYGIAVDDAGVVYVADGDYAVVRRIDGTGQVTTLAGVAGQKGNVQGAPNTARFNLPYGLAVGADGLLYVADVYNCNVVRIDRNGVVNLVAGRVCGSADGVGAAAQFSVPRTLAVLAGGDLVVSDGTRLRRIGAGGVVTTLAGGLRGTADGAAATATFDHPYGIAVDRNGVVYASEVELGLLRRLSAGIVDTPVGVRYEQGIRVGTAPRLAVPSGVAYDAAAHRLVVVEQAGVLTIVLP